MWVSLTLTLAGCEGPADPCDEVPTVNWANFGEGFLLGNCQHCHGSTAPNRHGAPTTVCFDTVEQVWSRPDRILARAGAEPATMPPEGVTRAEDRELLRDWLECGEPGS